jgi:hypothetical protein
VSRSALAPGQGILGGAVAAGDGSGTGADPEAVAAATLGGIAAIGVAGAVFLLRRRVRDER